MSKEKEIADIEREIYQEEISLENLMTEKQILKTRIDYSKEEIDCLKKNLAKLKE